MFLLSGISVTLWRDLGAGGDNGAAVAMFAPESPREVAVAAAEATVDERAVRLAALREKVAAQALVRQPDEVPEADAEEPTELPIEEVPSEPAVAGGSTLTCGELTTVAGSGFSGVTFKETLGQRALVRPADPVPASSATTSSSTDTGAEVAVLTLPWRSLPLPTPSCIATDVVGIALDGSFIRNDEHTVYGIFGADTLLGYALDGFPIYGTNNSSALDSCGGSIENGTYRYYLSSARDAVLGCYAGVPVRL